MKLFSTRNINTSIAAIAGVVLLAFLLAYSETGTPPALNDNLQAKEYPDFYLINSSSKQYNEAGQLDLIMQSQSLQHNPENNSISLQKPYLLFFQDSVATWEVKALAGTAYDSDNKIDLEQQAEIINESRQTSLKTPQLFIYPDKKRANTEKNVTLKTANGVTRAIGMKADLSTREIALLDQVRGQYEPSATPANVQ